MKQGHAAELLQVSQGTVSRWERGEWSPDEQNRARIAALIRANANSDTDAGIKRLIASCTLPIHLVCDATHELLAASPARVKSWRADPSQYLGISLWRFASEEIVRAEMQLEALGWFERPFQSFRFGTGDNGSEEIPVRPGVMQWETLLLSDGRVGRLTTTLLD